MCFRFKCIASAFRYIYKSVDTSATSCGKKTNCNRQNHEFCSYPTQSVTWLLDVICQLINIVSRWKQAELIRRHDMTWPIFQQTDLVSRSLTFDYVISWWRRSARLDVCRGGGHGGCGGTWRLHGVPVLDGDSAGCWRYFHYSSVSGNEDSELPGSFDHVTISTPRCSSRCFKVHVVKVRVELIVTEATL